MEIFRCYAPLAMFIVGATNIPVLCSFCRQGQPVFTVQRGPHLGTIRPASFYLSIIHRHVGPFHTRYRSTNDQKEEALSVCKILRGRMTNGTNLAGFRDTPSGRRGGCLHTPCSVLSFVMYRFAWQQTFAVISADFCSLCRENPTFQRH